MKNLICNLTGWLPALLCLLPLGALAQQTRPTAPQFSRIEVTKALDRKVGAEVLALIAPYKHSVDSMLKPVVGRSAQPMTSHRPESLLSNLIADIQFDQTKHYGLKPDLSVMNMGGIRSNLPAGDVTYGDVLNIAPFNNYLCIVTLKGSALKTLMAQIAARWGEAVSRNVRLVIAPDGSVASVTIGGKPIDDRKSYRVATVDYLAEGNDGMPAFKQCVEKKVYQNYVERDVLVGYFQRLKKAGRAAQSQLDGRVQILAAPTVPAEEVKAPEKDFAPITILHTNDTHSCVEPIDVNAPDTASADKGGYLRRTVLVQQEREIDPELLLLDCGDFSQGSCYYNLYKGRVEVELMNLMKYDATTIGNHEFDYGLDNLARLARLAKFPIVCANYDFTGTVVEGLVKPYTVIERAGHRIGVFGLSPRMEGLVAAANCQGVKYELPDVAAKRVVRQLREAEGCDVVICLSHLGWKIGQEDDNYLVPRTTGIDLVLGGHSHTYFSKPEFLTDADGRQVPVQQMGKNARFVGKVVLK